MTRWASDLCFFWVSSLCAPFSLHRGGATDDACTLRWLFADRFAIFSLLPSPWQRAFISEGHSVWWTCIFRGVCTRSFVQWTHSVRRSAAVSGHHVLCSSVLEQSARLAACSGVAPLRATAAVPKDAVPSSWTHLPFPLGKHLCACTDVVQPHTKPMPLTYGGITTRGRFLVYPVACANSSSAAAIDFAWYACWRINVRYSGCFGG